jgi:hypothetical protein
VLNQQKNEKPALWIANHLALAEITIGWGVRLGHIAEIMIRVNGVKSISMVAEKISHSSWPKWNEHIPHPTKKLSALRGLSRSQCARA